MSNILKTRDYNIFELHEFNRDVRKMANLEASMRRHGFISAYPLHVVRNGKKLKVKAGHHRLTVAKKLGIPVKYVVCDDVASIHELEAATAHWSILDWLTSYCRAGLADYLEVQKYCTETGINISCAISMLGGNSAGSGNFNKAFKAGTFKIKTTEHANTVADIVRAIRAHSPGISGNNLVTIAISKIVQVGRIQPNAVEGEDQDVLALPHEATKPATVSRNVRRNLQPAEQVKDTFVLPGNRGRQDA